MMITRLVVTLGPHTLHLAAAALAAAALAAAALAAAALAFDRENPSTGRKTKEVQSTGWGGRPKNSSKKATQESIESQLRFLLVL